MDRISQKIGAGFVGDPAPDFFHRRGIRQQDMGPPGEIDDDVEIGTRKHPLHGGMRLDLFHFRALW